MVALDGLHVLYTLNKEDDYWKLVKTESKKIQTVGSKAILEKAFLRAIEKKILVLQKHFTENQDFFMLRELLILPETYKMILMI